MRETFSLAILLLIGVVIAPRFASATSEEINLSFTGVTDPVSSDYVALFSGTSSGVTFDGYASLADIPTGDSQQSVVFSPPTSSTVQDFGGVTPTFIGLAGVYTAGDNTGVAVGVNTTTAATLETETYSQDFAPLGEPEAELVDFLESPNLSLLPTSLADFVNGFSGQLTPAVISLDGTDGTLVDFSDGTANGSASAAISLISSPGGGGTSAVPLPAAALMALPLMAILAGAKVLRRKIAAN
jgi:hypothetical protein